MRASTWPRHDLDNKVGQECPREVWAGRGGEAWLPTREALGQRQGAEACEGEAGEGEIVPVQERLLCSVGLLYIETKKEGPVCIYKGGRHRG